MNERLYLKGETQMIKFGFFTFMFTTLYSPSLMAAPMQFIVRGVNQQVLYQAVIDASEPTLGEFTERVLTLALAAKNINEYSGGDAGVSSINHLGSAFEKVSSSEFKAYGWCYEVDQKPSTVLSDQFLLDGKQKAVEWFYAYSHSVKGLWTNMCTRADHLPHE